MRMAYKATLPHCVRGSEAAHKFTLFPGEI